MLNKSQIIKGLLGLSLVACALPSLAGTDTTPESFQPMMKVSAIYSSIFGPLAAWKFLNYINPINAFGLEVNFGGKEFRLGGTWGHRISDQQRFKITAEHYAQQFTMHFISGNNTQWAGENDFGLAYQYLILDNRWLKSVNLGGAYTNAESENVGIGAINTPHGVWQNIKNFSGASTGNVNAGVTVSPWQTSLLTLGVDYDNVSYEPDYVPAVNNRSGLGATVSFEQLLTPVLKFDLLASHRQPFNQYQASVGWLLPTRPNTRLELTVLASHLTGDLYAGTDNRGMLSLAYSWGASSDDCTPAQYAMDQNNLSEWTDKPAVYMPAVLIMDDEAIRAY